MQARVSSFDVESSGAAGAASASPSTVVLIHLPRSLSVERNVECETVHVDTNVLSAIDPPTTIAPTPSLPAAPAQVHQAGILPLTVVPATDSDVTPTDAVSVNAAATAVTPHSASPISSASNTSSSLCSSLFATRVVRHPFFMRLAMHRLFGPMMLLYSITYIVLLVAVPESQRASTANVVIRALTIPMSFFMLAILMCFFERPLLIGVLRRFDSWFLYLLAVLSYATATINKADAHWIITVADGVVYLLSHFCCISFDASPTISGAAQVGMLAALVLNFVRIFTLDKLDPTRYSTYYLCPLSSVTSGTAVTPAILAASNDAEAWMHVGCVSSRNVMFASHGQLLVFFCKYIFQISLALYRKRGQRACILHAPIALEQSTGSEDEMSVAASAAVAPAQSSRLLNVASSAFSLPPSSPSATDVRVAEHDRDVIASPSAVELAGSVPSDVTAVANQSAPSTQAYTDVATVLINTASESKSFMRSVRRFSTMLIRPAEWQPTTLRLHIVNSNEFPGLYAPVGLERHARIRRRGGQVSEVRWRFDGWLRSRMLRRFANHRPIMLLFILMALSTLIVANVNKKGDLMTSLLLSLYFLAAIFGMLLLASVSDRQLLRRLFLRFDLYFLLCILIVHSVVVCWAQLHYNVEPAINIFLLSAFYFGVVCWSLLLDALPQLSIQVKRLFMCALVINAIRYFVEVFAGYSANTHASIDFQLISRFNSEDIAQSTFATLSLWQARYCVQLFLHPERLLILRAPLVQVHARSPAASIAN